MGLSPAEEQQKKALEEQEKNNTITPEDKERLSELRKKE